MSEPTPLDFKSAEGASLLPWFDRATVAAVRLLPGLGKKGVSNRILVAARGGAWTMFGYGGSQLLRFATQLVLARKLLGPQAFGLVALVSVFLSGLEMLSDLGIGMDVIQHPRGDEHRFINTAFLIQAGRGLILFALAGALAYPFAKFYHQPAVRWMIFVAAFSVGLRGLSSGSVWVLTRHVRLRELTALSLGGDSVGFVISVAWAIFSPTAWALVVGRVASSAVYVIASHCVGEERVSLDWDPKAARDIFLFGTGIFLSSATYFMSGEAERLIVGKFITVAELGCFSLALTLSAAPAQALSQVVGQVFFPMIAQQLTRRREHGRSSLQASALGLSGSWHIGWYYIYSLWPAACRIASSAQIRNGRLDVAMAGVPGSTADFCSASIEFSSRVWKLEILRRCPMSFVSF